MPLEWTSPHTTGGNLDPFRADQVRAMLDTYCTQVEQHLAALGLNKRQSLLWNPWHMVVIWDPSGVRCVFSPLTAGTSAVRWRQAALVATDEQIANALAGEFGWTEFEFHRLPHPGSPTEAADIDAVAAQYAAMVEGRSRLRLLGDLRGVEHLEPQLRQFLDDHPDPARNVFVMMRFHPSDQLKQVHAAITQTLAARNMTGLRADDRVYIDDLWDNIRVYMTGCRYGIAVYEDIDQRDFNPNVAIELGYMLGHEKRCLILKEKRLPAVPADIVGRLYKPWDAFNPEASVSAAVAQWIDVDLGL